MRAAAVAAFCGAAAALPGVKVPADYASSWCTAPECKPPQASNSWVANVKPRIQWDDAGGYCGSMAIQNVALIKGAWISQQQVRDHTSPGGGHDNEILATNIEEALRNLKLTFEGFDYKHLPTPQADAYRTWIKRQLVAGNGIAWMIMLKGGQYPVYPGLPYGFYSHVEPVLGIMSNRSFDDTKFYDDDVVVHGTDASLNRYYRTMKSLPDNLDFSGNCAHPDYLGYPCIYEKYGFGWAITGLNDTRKAEKLSLDVDKQEEPDTRAGRSPGVLHGTVSISDLAAGQKYVIHRWDSTADAFDYSKSTQTPFTAAGTTHTWEDPKGIMSNTATYYRCVKA
eukprot:TRINITY_DN8726_c0_g1_i1.p2 TRINITY_DN8726_c0_g1~~TRINITY_DN8726_c0_g1_i1.p2  ORF type:complete len:338 (+),score=134.23 TRINITY_DN8726_c0_g1_i1:61-1074(+)